MDRPEDIQEGLLKDLEETRRRLSEAEDTIEAIRTGQVDALIVQHNGEHQLYTLKSADHAYRMFIEKMNEGAITLNKEGIILYANTRFSDMIQLPLANIIGQPLLPFIAPTSTLFYERLFNACWNADVKGEVDINLNGQSIPTQLSLNKLEISDEILVNIIVTDLSGQKATQKILEDNNRQLEVLNKTLEASNHDLQQFASVASHDLQEPLRKIQIFGNLLKTESQAREGKEQQYLSKILNSAQRMKNLIVDILNYSRLSVNNGDFLPIDLNQVLQHILEDFELIIEEKGAQINITELPTMEVNAGQIRQVFQNLISNALKFTSPEKCPVVTIAGHFLDRKSFEAEKVLSGDFYLLSIEDNGIGFEEKYIPNIFSLFERLNGKEKYEGTGIGLAITKKIVEKHNGLITVNSEVGRGSIFKVIIPMKQPH